MAQTGKGLATSSTEGCGPENVINGISRTTESGSNVWESKPLGENGEGITLSLNKSQM